MSSKIDNLVHIQFEYDLALKIKRDIISSELNLVRISKIINTYKELRAEEIKIKEMISRRLRVFKIDLGTLQNLLPETRAPAIIKEIHREHLPEDEKRRERAMRKEEHSSSPEVPKVIEKMPEEDSLEAQLAEIQKRLASISG